MPNSEDVARTNTNDGCSETSQENGSEQHHSHHDHPPNCASDQTRKPAKRSEPFEKWERDEMEKLLKELNGHLGNTGIVISHLDLLFAT